MYALCLPVAIYSYIILAAMADFVETVTTVTTAGAANLYLRNVWKLHGLPRKVISNRGLQFVATFMKELYRLLGIEAATSTAYHLQTDRQTERVNQELEQYLQIFVGGRTTGTHSSPWRSSPTITTSTCPHSKHPSSSIPADTLGWASNCINLHPTSKRLMNSWIR